jgi:hypothetical protein
MIKSLERNLMTELNTHVRYICLVDVIAFRTPFIVIFPNPVCLDPIFPKSPFQPEQCYYLRNSALKQWRLLVQIALNADAHPHLQTMPGMHAWSTALAGEIKKLELTFSWWKKPDWCTELRAISQRSHALSFHTWPKCQRQKITWITHSNT